jgi:hypothetical protein
MIVVDASALLEVLLQSGAARIPIAKPGPAGAE